MDIFDTNSLRINALANAQRMAQIEQWNVPQVCRLSPYYGHCILPTLRLITVTLISLLTLIPMSSTLVSRSRQKLLVKVKATV